MRFLVIGALLLAAACSDKEDGGAVGDPCSLDEPCAAGGVCNLSNPEDVVCIVADGDIDADGLPNNRDFCNLQAGGEFDEDQDGVGDDCDRCPVSRPLGIADNDGDSVEAPCDPDPTQPGDRIIAFAGFNAGIPTGWKVNGPWEMRGGELAIVAPAATKATLTVPIAVPNNRLAVLGQYRVDSVDAAATTAFAGVTLLDVRPANTSAFDCGGERAQGKDNLILRTDVGFMSQLFVDLFKVGSLYKVAQRLEGATGGCSLIADAEQGAVSTTSGGEAPSEAGIAAIGVTARFQYLMVVQRSN